MQRLITLFPSARSHPPQKIQDDHLLLVFGFLDAWVLRVFMQTCKQFHRVACEDVLWRALLVAEIGESNVPALPLPDGPGGWRHRFIQWQRLGSCTLMTTPRPRAEPLDVGPTARFLHRAACLDSGRWLYVFGGRGQTDEFNDLWLLDKEQALGITPARSSSGTSGGGGSRSSSSSSGGGVSGGGSSSSGGSSSGGGIRSSDNGEAPAWRHVETVQPPPQRQSPTLTAIGTRLLMFGGRQGDVTFLNDTWLFDTESGAWACVRESDELPLLPGLAAHVYHTPPRPSPRWAHSAVAFGSSVLLFGGSAPGVCFNDLHWFDLGSLAWRKQVVAEGPTPPARSGHCACVLGDDSMFVVSAERAALLPTFPPTPPPTSPPTSPPTPAPTPPLSSAATRPASPSTTCGSTASPRPCGPSSALWGASPPLGEWGTRSQP